MALFLAKLSEYSLPLIQQLVGLERLSLSAIKNIPYKTSIQNFIRIKVQSELINNERKTIKINTNLSTMLNNYETYVYFWSRLNRWMENQYSQQ